jgi:MoaA/NifB/PqqE/SkfB family radical SAM enzyme
MRLEDLDKVIHFFRLSGMKTMRILGGEPTIHPFFPEVVDRVLEAGFDVRVFTGGLIPKKVKNHLRSIDSRKLMLIVNMSCPSETTLPGEYDKIEATLYDLAELSMLGYTIYEPRFDASFLIDLIVQSHCRPRIRLGIGVPIVDAEHPLISPRQYKKVAQHIVRLAEQCDRHDIAMELDCGFPFCMFTPIELGYLKSWNCTTNFVCSPILDISPTLEVWPCFALSSMYRAKLEDFTTRQECVAYFAQKSHSFSSFGVYDHCHECKYKKREQCAGGCLSHTIRSFK